METGLWTSKRRVSFLTRSSKISSIVKSVYQFSVESLLVKIVRRTVALRVSARRLDGPIIGEA
jgi:hypothetical protein